MEWLRTAARAHVGAMLHGHTAPERDAAQAHADRMRLTRWDRAHGVLVDGEGARSMFWARLTTMAARHAADPP